MGGRWSLMCSGAALCSTVAWLTSCHVVAGLDDVDESRRSTAGSASGGAGGTGGTAEAGGTGGTGGTGGSVRQCPSGYACVPDITTGSFVRAPANSNTCDGAWSIEASYAAPVDPGCESCSCGTPQGGSCSVHTESFNAFNCTQQVGNSDITGTMCLDLGGIRSAFLMDPPTAQGGSCAAMGGGPVQLTTTTVCSSSERLGLSCGAGMVCVPEGSGELCNIVSDNQSCSEGYQDTRGPLAAIEGDDRQCLCNCDAPVNPTCANAGGIVHANNNCTSPLDSVPANGQCTDTVNSSGSFFVDAGTWSADTCVSTIDAGGSVTFGPNEKLCCLAR